MHLSPKLKPNPSARETSAELRGYWSDVAIIGCLAILAAILTHLRFQSLDPVVYQDFTEDVWFGSDIERTIGNISDRSRSFRAGVHPLFPLLIYPLVRGTRKLLGTDTIFAIQVVMTLATAVWVSLLAVTFRLIGCQRIDTVLYSLLIVFSAGVMFWTTVPESYLFGSISMTVPIFIVALDRYVSISPYWYILISAFSLSITTTNWMAGIFATWVTHAKKQAVVLIGKTFLLVSGLWIFQKQIFYQAQFFLASDVIQEELKYVSPQASGGPLRVISGFIFHPMVMPKMTTIASNRGLDEWPLITVQTSNLGSSGWVGTVATMVWAALLLLGFWSLFSKQVDSKLRLFILLTLAGQMTLHLVYGEETFLYALHFLPFLITVVAVSSLTRLRMVSLALASALVLLAAANNSVQFNQASDFLKHEGPLREQAIYVNPSTHHCLFVG